MPDISMCMTVTCPSFNTCYRAQAMPHGNRQSYIDYKPDPELGKCESYLHFEKNNDAKE